MRTTVTDAWNSIQKQFIIWKFNAQMRYWSKKRRLRHTIALRLFRLSQWLRHRAALMDATVLAETVGHERYPFRSTSSRHKWR